jgi:excisionase family DNA binding protein
MPSTTRWLTRSEAAERLRVKPRTIDTYARTGKLPRYYLAGSTRAPRFRAEDVDALVEQRAAEQREADQ